MKILYIITGLGIGGAEVMLADVCKAIADSNDITVLYLNELSNLEHQLNDIGVKTVSCNLKKKGLIQGFFFVKKFIKKGAFDIVHTHLPAADTIGRLAALLARKNIPVISTIHNMDEWKKSKKPQHALLRFYNRVTVNRFKNVRLIAVAKCVKDFCVLHEKINPEKITVLYNFIDYNNPVKVSNDFDAEDMRKPDRYTLINVGRLEPQKGQMILLKAIDELCNNRKITNLYLYILGDGSMRGEMEEYIKEHNLSEYIRMMGFVKNTFDYLRNADLFVFSSVHEGFGIAAFEAFYCRIPVITSDIDTAKELMEDGEDSIFFTSMDFIDLADKIELFAKGRVDVSFIKENAFEKSLELSLDTHKEKLIETYEESLKTAKA